MIKIYEKETEFVNKFIQKFSDSAMKTLYQNLDKDVFSKIEFIVDKSSSIDDLTPFKENNVFYKIDYTKGVHPSTLAILVPEELLAMLTDVMMGGKGDNPYKGTLSELEVNSASNLFKKVVKDIENLFKKTYTEDFAFEAGGAFLLKEMPEYEEEFNKHDFDFLVNQTLKINDDKEFTINLLLKSSDLKNTLVSLRLLQEEKFETISDSDSISLNQIAGVKIDITAELGRARVPIKYALGLVKGSIIELETLNNSDIKVFANDVEVAMAQVVVVEENFGLRITKIIAPEERLKAV